MDLSLLLIQLHWSLGSSGGSIETGVEKKIVDGDIQELLVKFAVDRCPAYHLKYV